MYCITLLSCTFIFQLILSILLFNQGFHLPGPTPENVTLESYKEIINIIQYKPTILLFSLMQIIYSLNFILKEYKITTTFFWQSEGVGYMQLVASALYPFYFTSITKFLVDSKLTLSTNAHIAASVVYMAGFIIMLLSNSIKHEFRKNPLHPSLTRKFFCVDIIFSIETQGDECSLQDWQVQVAVG